MSKKTSLLERATDAAETAREAATEFVDSTARPALHDAAHRAQAKAVPLVAAGATLAAEKAAHAKEFADSKAAELTGRKKKKRSKMKAFLMLSLLAAVVGAVARKLTSKSDWVSYAPTGTSAATPRASANGMPEEDPAETFRRDVIDPDAR
ncbi:MAG TPA: hypothetical protein VGE38_17285 [Nocardioides sp.]|uniref:hypothetical protein n=1 Tax=Nocardioides sp. TaxID=35761 RepID=UPI002ED81459